MKPYVVRACRAWMAGALLAASPLVSGADAVERALEQGKPKLAAQVAAERLVQSPDDRHTHFLYGLALARSGQTDKAIDVYTELAEANPERPEPANNLAVLHARQGDYEKARDWLEKAMATHPAYATAHRNLADVYTALAAVAYSKALEEQEGARDLGVELSLVDQVYGQAQAPDRSSTRVAQAPRQTGESARKPEEPAQKPESAQQAKSESSKGPQIIDAPKPHPEPARPPQEEKDKPESEATPDGDKLTDKRQRRILASVRGWSAAWSDQDVESYLAAYADTFQPEERLTLSQWRAQRRERVASPEFIKVQVVEPEVGLIEPDRAKVRFKQVYESDTYSDRVRKTLTLEKRGEHWLIVREESEPLGS